MYVPVASEEVETAKTIILDKVLSFHLLLALLKSQSVWSGWSRWKRSIEIQLESLVQHQIMSCYLRHMYFVVSLRVNFPEGILIQEIV